MKQNKQSLPRRLLIAHPLPWPLWEHGCELHALSITACRVEDSGTEASISVIIAVINILLKLFVQYLAAEEKQWTRSEMVRIYPVLFKHCIGFFLCLETSICEF